LRRRSKVGGIRRDYTITYSRYGDDNKTRGYAYAGGDAPEVREADAERYSALVEALTGEEAEGVPHEGRHHKY